MIFLTKKNNKNSRRRRSTSHSKLGRISDYVAHVRRPFWLLAALIVGTFLTGGGSRGDIASLMLLRPFACLMGTWGALSLSSQHVKSFRWLFILATCCAALLILQLLPLPYQLFALLPQHAIVEPIDRVAGLGGVWQPLSLAPLATLNALGALCVPISGLILCAQLDDDEQRLLLGLILCLGGTTALLALAQIFSDPEGPLYFYEHTNNGEAVGLFANRNHQALFLASMFPMLMVWGSARNRRMTDHERAKLERGLLLMAGLALVPMILITGSRAGLITGAIALVSLLLLRRQTTEQGDIPSKEQWRKRAQQLVVFTAMGGLAVLAIFEGRAEAWNRLWANSPADDMRYKILPAVLGLLRELAPWGGGAGSFEKLYQLKETDQLLSPIIMNQAHNDWLDTLLTDGIVGIAILVLALILWIVGGLRVLKQPVLRTRTQLGRVGIIVVTMIAVASISDYPLRVPAIEILLVVCAAWIVRAQPSSLRSVNLAAK